MAVETFDPRRVDPHVYGPSIDSYEELLQAQALQGRELITPPIVVAPGGHAPVVLTHGATDYCLGFNRDITTTGYGSCRAIRPDSVPIVILQGSGPATSADTVYYIAWPEVPDDAAFVTFEYGSVRSWQRPFGGASVFAFSHPEVEAELAKGEPSAPVVFRAFDANGVELGSAARDPLRG
jgi:hypothetical protein